MKKEFLHCLRIQFYPGHYEDERIAEVVDYCRKFGFNNVMLFINAEEYHVGHMTKEEAAPWLKTMKKAKATLEKEGISVSLNPWAELGHLDRCRVLKEGQNFTTQVDCDGKQCSIVACPLCEEWKAYFLDFYKYIVRELDPKVVWVEDDFRLHNHGDLKYGGCFCKLHMQKYNQCLGTHYTREEFIQRLYGKSSQKRVKKAWLDVNRECMASLAEDIGKAVKSLGLGTQIGLMSSLHEKHATEGRDWHRVQRGFACGGEIISRLHLPCYREISGKEYYLEFNRASFHCRALLPKKTRVYPELENATFSTFAKDARFLRFQLESAIPLCIDGMTYDIYDFVGNGIVDTFGYGECVREITPYLNGVLSLNLNYDTLDGIILPIDEKTVYKSNAPVHDIFDFIPKESHFNAYIASLGVNCKPSVNKTFCGKVVALGGGNAYNFTKEQLIRLFADNYVVLDGGAARILIDRGLGNLFGAKAYRTYVGEHDVHSYEQVKAGVKINGKEGYRATSYASAGDYVKIDYVDESGAQSFVYDYLGNQVGVGDFNGGKYFVIPYVIDHCCLEQYNDLRTTLLKAFLKSTSERLIYSEHAGVYTYTYRRRANTVLTVVNSTEEDFDKTRLTLQNVKISKLYAIDRKSGKKRPVSFEEEGNVIVIDSKNEHLTTQTFLFE